ncbi:MAG: hypothetical protein H6563_03885 [Lewinellaceae bacterium]|nr:hypothetical protein [Lewinellaceae bacterium]
MKALKIILINLLMVLVFAELGLRLLGFTGLHPYTVVSSPTNCLRPSEEMGFELNPGAFSVVINENLRYSATHLDCGWGTVRTTGRPLASSDSLILLTGCSFTYGMGVDDSLTYPFRLQALFPDHTIVNAAVPAHGTLQTLLLLDWLLKSGVRPARLIYHYISLHEDRNILGRSFQQLLARESRVGSNSDELPKLPLEAYFPYGKIDQQGNLTIQHSRPEARNLLASLRSYSALVNQLEFLYTRVCSSKMRAEKVTEAALSAIAERCQQESIPFTVAILEENADHHLRRFCRQKSIPFLDLTLDYSDESLLNLPYDSHPNAKAHGLWAAKMEAYLFP